ncbi:glycosyltransferase [Sinorhizobium medicae]|uniref:Glycosyltransferase n=1 Tax=Sinorhizobium medicae TaxID=110321 RepID=A0A6G1WIS5_9HYPH|nr:glycosyltransferase family 4 protein [Sinorhizobium medicae]MDX0408197.1 glycosyltransferase [Sinorhizobium medicae]MDX0414298.1 glycosyltransferase [Sinorhizobium medicae]MDX0420127.1 glycosyltransferase [Sinorhizobium medicae]MDX0426553.1 glycosyltransferase [Sinorhizobium medicae]MDX0432366.1 glycosyltransferase [Sinorhizobium medicae]
MKIAFHAPLKSPDHPVPSGDRQMARMLIEALRLAGHDVAVVSQLRSFLREASHSAFSALRDESQREIDRIRRLWRSEGPPDVWFCYHPYYKAPDLIGPSLSTEFSIPYVTAESSYSYRRNIGAWKLAQDEVAAGARRAAVNVCFTQRDRHGLDEAIPGARTALLAPFIDVSPFRDLRRTKQGETRLLAVAMMRAGDKMDSFRMLARSLALVADLPWKLTVIGDGPARAEVLETFAAFPSERLEWLGEKAPQAVPALLAAGDLYIWPGCGEAYGLAYLEAQAAGLPVVAQRTAGVPEVVRDGETGCLTTPGNIEPFAAAVRQLLVDEASRKQMAERARQFVFEQRSLPAAAARLSGIFAEFVECAK